MWNEIKRKFFHLLALIYVVGLVFLPRPTFLLVLGILLVLDITVELLRLKNPTAQQWFTRFFGHIIREKEKSHFSGVFWMLLGVLLTAAITPPVSLAVTALLYLILGDGVASLAGMRFQGPHWPRSNKRISGSLACFLVCVFVGFVLLRPEYGWHGVIIGATAATVLEQGVVPVNDNLAIPVLSAATLLACYGVRPFF